MITVELKALIGRLNSLCTQALEGAGGLVMTRGQYEIAVEHFMLKLLEHPQSDFCLALRHFEIDLGRFAKALEQDLEEFRTGNQGRPTFSPLLVELLQDAWLIASVDQDEPKIRSGSLLLSFLAKPNLYASGRAVDFLKRIGRDTLKGRFWDIVKGSDERIAPGTAAAPGAPAAPGAAPAVQQGDTAIGKFCTDFTAQARAGKIDPVFGRDDEIRQMIDIFARRRKNNPICVGEPGVGKTAVVEGLALRAIQDDVPDILKDVRIVGLDMGLLQAGAGMKGEFENRLNGVINEVKASSQPIILFIDEAHTLIGAGGQAGGGDAANLLKPALARGELRTVAATTWSEYKKYFEKDPALARRFQLVKLDEPDVETATLILRGLKENYEKSHNVTIRDDAIVAAAEMADRYITGRYLPDKAVDLLDTSGARIKVQLTAKPAVLEDKERAIQALQREIDALERDKRNGEEFDVDALQQSHATMDTLTGEAAELEKEWQRQQQAAHKVIALRQELTALAAPEQTQESETAEGDEAPAEKRSRETVEQELNEARARLDELQQETALVKVEVDPEVVAKVIADWTGIPAGKVLRDEAANVLELPNRMRERIRGQDHAIDSICQVIKASKSGLKDPQQPMGVFLLVGPSGVGKTETALTVADQLFGGERNVVTVNMSEFMEKHTVSRLIGSPPGYVGYGEGGVLTEGVRQKPYSAVLLDECEKAHPEVLNLFYQVFDKGSLSDGEGRDIDFKNTILFLTSNLATDEITALTRDGTHPPMDELVGQIRPILSNHFKPALLARMTIVPYYALPPEAIKEIVMLKLDKLATRMKNNQGMQLQVSANVVEQITARCQEVETGARNIDHILNGTVLPAMSQRILAKMGDGEAPAVVKLDFAEDGQVLVETE